MGGGGHPDPAGGPRLDRRRGAGRPAEGPRLQRRGDTPSAGRPGAGAVDLPADADHSAGLLRALWTGQLHRPDDRMPSRPDLVRGQSRRAAPPRGQHQGQPGPEAVASHPGRAVYDHPRPRHGRLVPRGPAGRRLGRDLAGAGGRARAVRHAVDPAAAGGLPGTRGPAAPRAAGRRGPVARLLPLRVVPVLPALQGRDGPDRRHLATALSVELRQAVPGRAVPARSDRGRPRRRAR